MSRRSRCGTEICIRDRINSCLPRLGKGGKHPDHPRTDAVLIEDRAPHQSCLLYTSRYAFPPDIYAEPLRVLLTRLCYLRDALPQGAPTSPAISNLVLADFDRALTSWCAPRGIAYTPVSYTHLDVYKRQLLSLTWALPPKSPLSIETAAISAGQLPRA